MENLNNEQIQAIGLIFMYFSSIGVICVIINFCLNYLFSKRELDKVNK